MKKPLVLILSVFMALLFCGCTTYCYEDTVSDMEIMYGSYFMSMSEYNPDGAAVSCYAWDGDPEKTDIVIPEKYGKQKIKCLGGYWGKGAPSPFFIDCDSYLGIKSDVDEMGESMTFSMDASMIEPGTRVIYTDFTINILRRYMPVRTRPNIRSTARKLRIARG